MSMWWEITEFLFKPSVDFFPHSFSVKHRTISVVRGSYWLQDDGGWWPCKRPPQNCQLELSLHSLTTAQNAREQCQKLGGIWDR